MKHTFVYHVLAFVIVAVWGVTFISTKVLINHGLNPAQIFTIRFIMAYVGLVLFSLFRGEGVKAVPGTWKDELLFLFVGITGGSLYFMTENSALVSTQACNVSFIVCSAPLLTTLFTMAFRKISKGELARGLQEVRVTPFLVIGTLLAFLGMGLIIFDGAQFHFSLKGDLLALGAAVTWGLYSIVMGQLTVRFGTMVATRKVFFYGLITIIPFVLINGSMTDGELTSLPVIGNLLFLGVVASLLCYVGWNKVMAEIGNVTSTNYVYLNPFFTLVAAVLILGESMSLVAALGSASIFIGVYLAGRK